MAVAHLAHLRSMANLRSMAYLRSVQLPSVHLPLPSAQARTEAIARLTKASSEAHARLANHGAF